MPSAPLFRRSGFLPTQPPQPLTTRPALAPHAAELHPKNPPHLHRSRAAPAGSRPSGTATRGGAACGAARRAAPPARSAACPARTAACQTAAGPALQLARGGRAVGVRVRCRERLAHAVAALLAGRGACPCWPTHSQHTGRQGNVEQVCQGVARQGDEPRVRQHLRRTRGMNGRPHKSVHLLTPAPAALP